MNGLITSTTKTITTMKKVLALSVFIYCINLAFGQNANPANWMASANQMPGNLKAFQENKGQFKNLINDWTITYGANCGGVEVLFTSKGVLYYLPERVKMTNEKTNGVNRREPEAEKEQEAENETKYKIIYHKVAVEWENANTNPVIEARDETPYLFGKIDPDKATGIDNISGFKKLVYHNVYPGIDIEFTFHPDKGIKYTIKVKPGYDASVLKMRYLGPDGLNLDAKGNIHIKTPIGDIIDHSPLTMQNGKQVNSSFQKVSGNEIKFTVAKSGNSSALVIDPWVVFPISPAKAEPMDIGMDAANNVYVLEWDSSAMYIQKYLSTGALSWTYDLSQYGRNTAISDLAVDPLGNTYTPQSWYYTNAGGGSYAMLCLSSTGTLKYFYNTYNNSQGIVFETWGTAYSPVTGNLIECGAPNILSNQTGIINSANGNFLGPIHTDTLFDEIAAVTIGSNGVMYGLTGNKCFCNSGAGSYTNTLVAFNISGVTPALMWSKRIPTYNFQDFQQKNLAGIAYNGISTGAGSIYTSDGLKLYRFNINTGSLMDSALIPGGRDAGKLINSGIAVDTMCGYVYVGSRTDVQVYTTSLIPVTTLACPGLVNDIAYGNGLVSACGSTSSIDSSFVVQFTGQTCLSVTVAVTSNVNCNGGSEGSATVTATGGKTPYTYSWAPSGGSSSTATGLSAGTYTVTVKDNNGVTRTVSVTITQPAALADATPTINSNVACYGGNGSATAAIPTGGTSPYTYAWNGGATSTDATNTVLSAGTYTVNITDANGCIVNSTGTVTITQPAAL
ncbi:MAG TPA: hypothetical protein VNZ45_13250, partial [Bacteroidia bacterium]|nr:hypothetical protein [Bacteroidia bacterium]